MFVRWDVCNRVLHITDDEFECDIQMNGRHSDMDYETAIIEEYERRQLPVVPNLIRAVLHSLRYTRIGVILYWNSNAKFEQYIGEDELDKYLVLL